MQRDDSRCPRRPPGESGQRLRLTAELDLSGDYFGNDGHAVLNPQAFDIAMLESAAVIDQRLPRRVEVLWLIRLPCQLAVLPLQGCTVLLAWRRSVPTEDGYERRYRSVPFNDGYGRRIVRLRSVE